MTYRIGFDIGGTFTDLLLVDEERGRFVQEKVPTTESAYWQGVIDGLERILARDLVTPDRIGHVSHGTTVATNALLEQEGAATGLITTEGFRDVIAIGREKRAEIYNLTADTPPTFTERRHRYGVSERMTAGGEVLTPLDEPEVEDVLDSLGEAGIESIAVSLLHAYANDAHERRIEAAAKDRGFAVARSSAVMNEIKEYERTLSTVINAYVGPIVDGYIDTLSGKLREQGIEESLHLMQANGGVVTPDTVGGRQIQLINSGPAAGVLGAKHLASASGVENLITLDMGGTSTDICLVHGGEIERTTEGAIESIPLLFRQIDVRSIGAGGGSIAWIDRGGTLKVGPKSAGAEPGPACYGRGGTEPTVTDAAVVLGYLDPAYFLGGEMALDAEAADTALAGVADSLGLTRRELADGIVDIVANNMMRGIRLVSVEKGYDPRGFCLTCFGGAGPMFATRLAGELEIDHVLIPRAPGVLSTVGLVTADRRYDFSSSNPIILSPANVDEIKSVYDDLESQALAVAGGGVTLRRRADVRYLGQTFKLTIEVPTTLEGDALVDGIRGRFFDRYEAIYGHVNQDDPVEAVTWRVEAVDEVAPVSFEDTGTPGRVNDSRKGERDVYRKGETVTYAVYDRSKLPAGHTIAGPAVVEEPKSTTVVEPGWEFAVDGIGNLQVHRAT